MTRKRRLPARQALIVVACAAVAVPVLIDTADLLLSPATERQNDVALDACRRVAETCRDALVLVGDEGTGRPVSINAIRFDGDSLAFRAAVRRAVPLGGDVFTLHPDTVLPTNGRTIVAVSPIPFSDVPRPRIWTLYRRQPAHAVGYSDGSVELVSVAEFAELDLRDFVLMSDWLSPPSVDDRVRFAALSN